MSTVWAGQGTVLKATISSSLTAIAQVLEIDGPGIEVGTIETTNLGSTSKSRRAQLPDSGKITATIQYDPTDTTHQFLTTTILTWPQAAITWELLFPSAVGSHNYQFSAILTKFAPKGFNEEDNIEADIELELTGTITVT